MIDLHNHILAGIDDGATDIDESLDIARQFVSEGVTAIAVTPHLDPENRRGAPGHDVIGRVEELRRALAVAEIVLEVSTGHELYLTPDAEALLKSGTALPLGSGTTVLVEVSLNAGKDPLYLEDTLFQLQMAGYRPMLAHPERYPFVGRSSTLLEDLVARGIVLQLTAPSLLGHYGAPIRRVATRLLRAGMYAAGGSDRHHPGPERSLVDMHRRISELTDEQTADLLLRDNPARLLADEDVVLPERRVEDRERRSWLALFRGVGG